MARFSFTTASFWATLIAAVAISSTASAQFAPTPPNIAPCARGLTEHRVDWLAFADSDADPSGVPRRLEGRTMTKSFGDTIHMNYAGLTRRFDFDSPRVMEASNLREGFLRTDFDLLQFDEYVDITMSMPRPLSRFTLVFSDLGESHRADGGVRDAAWLEGVTASGQRIMPSYFYPSTTARDSSARVSARVRAERFGAPWITGERRNSVQGPNSAEWEYIGATFNEPVISVLVRYSGFATEQGSWAHGVSANPPRQTIDIVSGSYCAVE